MRLGNLQVICCSTSANYFHALRRQLHRGYRKPLIAFNSKKLLKFKGVFLLLCRQTDQLKILVKEQISHQFTQTMTWKLRMSRRFFSAMGSSTTISRIAETNSKEMYFIWNVGRCNHQNRATCTLPSRSREKGNRSLWAQYKILLESGGALKLWNLELHLSSS